MEPRAHHVLIGLFTLLASITIVLFALWLARANQQGQVDYYNVIFNEPVRGLARGNAVLYNGIRIGEVTELHLDAADLRQAHAQIAIDASIPIRMDTRAKLVLTGITGVSVIELSGGSPLSPLLADPDDGYPTIIATPSPLNQLLAGGDSLMTNVSELVLSAKEMLSSDNAAHLTNILAHVDTLTGSLATHGDDFAALLSDVKEASAQAQTTLKQAGTLIDTTNSLVVEHGSKAIEHAERSMASLDRASASLASLIKNSEPSVVSGLRGLNELGPTLQALRRTLASIQDVVSRLDENPSRYLLGHDQIQEFEP